MKIKKLSLSLLLPVSLLLMLSGWVVHVFTTQEAQYSYASPSGRYIFQNVLLMPWLGAWCDLAYIRVIDTQLPDVAFRTPLYNRNYTDMRAHEDDKIVGVVWFDFDKQKHFFRVGVPDWQDNWLNIFISNTPYEIVKN